MCREEDQSEINSRKKPNLTIEKFVQVSEYTESLDSTTNDLIIPEIKRKQVLKNELQNNCKTKQLTDINMGIENEAQSKRQQTTEKQTEITLQDVFDKLSQFLSRIENKLDDHNSRFKERSPKYEEQHNDSASVNKIKSHQKNLSQSTGLTSFDKPSLDSTGKHPNLGQPTSTKIILQRTLTATFCIISSTPSDQSLLKYWDIKRHKELQIFKGPKSKTRPTEFVTDEELRPKLAKEKKPTLISSLMKLPRQDTTLLTCSKKFKALRPKQEEKG